jgi:hypothetical protein
MTNNSKAPVTKALSGFALWSMGGHFFGVPGLGKQIEGPSTGAMADRVVAYDQDWAIAMHMPHFDRFDYGQRDRYRETTLRAGESRTFEGWLQVVPRGDLAPIVSAEVAREGHGIASIAGRVMGAGGVDVQSPIVVVERDGTPFAWTQAKGGHYALSLAPGHYRLYATGSGYTDSPRVDLDLATGSNRTQDFSGLEPSGRLRLSVRDRASGRPIDARINIEQGKQPLVEYLGRHSFFTELNRIGEADIVLAPGRYVLSIQSGAGFTARPERIALDVRAGQAYSQTVRIDRLFRPEARGWYSADMHHHSDQADGVTPPEELARSELAAGLDLLVVSDHDLTTNHKALQAIADRRGIPFIPSAEFSPSWGHFNAYPLKLGEPVRLEMATATASDVFAEARRLGATTIQVNHPDDPGEGYLASVDRGVAHGGLDRGYDLLEINGLRPADDAKVLKRAWASWSSARPYFLSAGSDTHDVWNGVSGDARLFAHVSGTLTVTRFVEAARQGRSYVSHGPLIFPDHMFGQTLSLPAGSSVTLGFNVKSVNGVKGVFIVQDGKVSRVITYRPGHLTVHVSVVAAGRKAKWYALMVEDFHGHFAYTNPIWNY